MAPSCHVSLLLALVSVLICLAARDYSAVTEFQVSLSGTRVRSRKCSVRLWGCMEGGAPSSRITAATRFLSSIKDILKKEIRLSFRRLLWIG